MADLYDAEPISNQHWVDVLPSWPAQRLSGSQQTQTQTHWVNVLGLPGWHILNGRINSASSPRGNPTK